MKFHKTQRTRLADGRVMVRTTPLTPQEMEAAALEQRRLLAAAYEEGVGPDGLKRRLCWPALLRVDEPLRQHVIRACAEWLTWEASQCRFEPHLAYWRMRQAFISEMLKPRERQYEQEFLCT